MYYDYPEEEFYPESEYQEQIDALKEAIKSSVKSEILEEMNRLRAENEKLQGIKEHFEEVKKDYEKKKDECDRIIRNAEYNAKKMRLADLMKDHKVIKWKVRLFEGDVIYNPEHRTVRMEICYGKYAAFCPNDKEYMETVGFYMVSNTTDDAMPLGPTKEYALLLGNVVDNPEIKVV